MTSHDIFTRMQASQKERGQDSLPENNSMQKDFKFKETWNEWQSDELKWKFSLHMFLIVIKGGHL